MKDIVASDAVFARAVITTGDFMYFLVILVAETREESEARASAQGLEGVSDASAMMCFHRLLGHQQ